MCKLHAQEQHSPEGGSQLLVRQPYDLAYRIMLFKQLPLSQQMAILAIVDDLLVMNQRDPPPQPKRANLRSVK